MTTTFFLNDLPLNSYGMITNINSIGSDRRRFLDLGLITNTKIRAILKSPSGDLRAYEIRGTIIAIRDEDAKKIEIKEA